MIYGKEGHASSSSMRGQHRAGALTLTHLRGSSDYRSCQHLAQRSVLTQLNGSPKTSVNTAVNTVLTHAPGKTRVYLQKTGYTREIPGSASMPRSPTPRATAPTAARTVCSSTRTAPCVLATSAKTQKAASAPGTACRRRCGRRGRANILLQDRGGARHALVRPRSTDRKEAAQQADCCRQHYLLPHAR